MSIDAERLRALANEATPGPWQHVAVRHMQHEVFTRDDDRAEGQSTINCWHRADAEYIAAISPDVLIALLDQFEQYRRWAEEAIDKARVTRDAFAQLAASRAELRGEDKR